MANFLEKLKEKKTLQHSFALKQQQKKQNYTNFSNNCCNCNCLFTITTATTWKMKAKKEKKKQTNRRRRWKRRKTLK